MRGPARRLIRALDTFNARHPWDHNAHYHRWILRQLPRDPRARALDVGCGSGDLARLLLARAGSVDAVDADPRIVGQARRATPPHLPVRFIVADAPGGAPPGPYAVITCVAVLHHLPFEEALRGFRARLAPGGTLVVVGLHRATFPLDHLLGLVAAPANVLVGLVRNRGRGGVRPVSMTARTRPAAMTFADIARRARRELPGARLRRRLFWRHTLVWRDGGR